MAITLLLAFVGGAWGYTKIRSAYPARTRVERSVMLLLMLASMIAMQSDHQKIAE